MTLRICSVMVGHAAMMRSRSESKMAGANYWANGLRDPLFFPAIFT
jgi:hypothetical protein